MSRGRDEKNKKQESEIETKKDTDKTEAITAAEENTESETHTGTEEKTDSAEMKPENEKEDGAEKKEESVSLYETDPFIDPSIYRQKRRKKLTKKITVITVLSLFVVYFGGVIFHMNHFGTMTYINGIDVSGRSVKKTQELLLADAEKYNLDIKFKNAEFHFAVGDGDSTVELTDTVQSLLKKNTPFMWFADCFRKYDYKIGYTVVCDEQKLKDCLTECPALDGTSMVESRNAKVVLQDGEAKIIPDETGTRIDTEKLYDKLTNALKNYEETFDVAQEDCYVPAHVLTDSESILRAKENADAFISIDAVYHIDDYTYEIPKEELTKMAYVSDDGSIRISKSNVEAYVEKLKEQFSTVDTDREFVTHDKKTILVHGRNYGWRVDVEAETEELYAALSEKKSFEKDLNCSRHGYAYTKQNDIGSTYVEIDLTNQHVYFYQDGTLKWDSDCVTGQTPGHKTPGGLYSITYKERNATLVGADYETPVAYWMPFNGGIGLHDANWRGSFGGEIYTYNGSHGCVNLPPSKAGELYDYLEAGLPVVCYWRDEVTFVNK